MANKPQKGPGKRLLEKIQNQIQDIKSELNQSEKEALDSLKQESSHFREELHKAENELQKLEQYNENDAQFLKKELNHLDEELQDTVKSKDVSSLADNRYKLDRTFNRFRDRAKSSFRNASAKLKNSWDKLVDRLEHERKDLDSHIEIHKLQYEHEDEDMSNRLKLKKEKISNEIGKLEQRIEESLSRSTIQMQHRATEISQKFREFKTGLTR